MLHNALRRRAANVHAIGETTARGPRVMFHTGGDPGKIILLRSVTEAHVMASVHVRWAEPMIQRSP